MIHGNKRSGRDLWDTITAFNIHLDTLMILHELLALETELSHPDPKHLRRIHRLMRCLTMPSPDRHFAHVQTYGGAPRNTKKE